MSKDCTIISVPYRGSVFLNTTSGIALLSRADTIICVVKDFGAIICFFCFIKLPLFPGIMRCVAKSDDFSILCNTA